MKKQLLALGMMLTLILPVQAQPVHAIAMHGTPKYGADFKNFDYVNPNAPKGGVLRQATFGSFDTFNPFVIKGNAAAGTGLVFETLMSSSMDEAFTEYGLVADSIEVPDNRAWVAFHINPKARFSNGTPITADDVVFTFEMLKQHGVPQYRYYYGDVQKVEATAPDRVLFTFKSADNRELPLILGQMPVLSKADWPASPQMAGTPAGMRTLPMASVLEAAMLSVGM